MSYCPECQHPKSEVKETRRYKDYENWTSRTRQCYNCQHVFKTVEMEIGELEQIARQHDSDTEIAFDERAED